MIATGIAATASSPNSSANGAAVFPGLLLDVRAANGSGRSGTADHARDGDQRNDVRKRLEERRGGLRVDGQPVGDRRREPEQERRSERAEGTPVPKDERRQGDEAP